MNEEDLKNIIVHLTKNDLSKFAENVGWTQVGKKGKKIHLEKQEVRLDQHKISKKWNVNVFGYYGVLEKIYLEKN